MLNVEESLSTNTSLVVIPSNVIQFPKAFRVPPVSDINKRMAQDEQFMHYHINAIVNNVMQHLMESAMINDIPLTMDVEDDTMQYTTILTLESMKALLLRVYGFDHPLQKAAGELFGPPTEKSESTEN
jgi:hypothetical protein